jgi:uncharacterized protein involved in response to NO
MDILKFPLCKHRKAAAMAPVGTLRWLASEPFRVFFLLGSLWSVAAVALWPLFYQGKLPYYPNVAHAHLMIQGFAGAFVIGFLGTAGPRMASAPKLHVAELFLFIILHSSSAVLHLCHFNLAGDALFAVTLLAFIASLLWRVLRNRADAIPPQMMLSMGGLLCALLGTLLIIFPQWQSTMFLYRFSSLLLYQGFLLLPILGIGSFLFPRILGGGFGEAKNPKEQKALTRRCALAGLLIIASLALEALGFDRSGVALRAGTMILFFAIEIRWRRAPGEPRRGTLATGVFLSIIAMVIGLLLAGWMEYKRIPVMHLFYVSGVGMLILVVASRVLFGHSGDLPGFSRTSWWVRFLLFLMLLAAATRASSDFLPNVMITHYQYAAWTWIAAVVLWVIWHRKRWITRDNE